MDGEASDIWYDLDGPTPMGRYLYHYTGPTTASLILTQFKLRMGPYWATNDPREAREWFPSMSVPEGVELRTEEWLRLGQEIDEVMRKRVQLSCFTQDRDSGDPLGAVWHFHRGWARARMWQQYAGDHTGLCLVLDRTQWTEDVGALTAARKAEVISRGDALDCFAAHAPVVYEDLPVGWDARTLHFSLTELKGEGVGVVAERRVRENIEALFLSKNTDWESEQEYRSLVIGTEDPLFVPLNRSLRAIVVGEGCSPELADEARALVRAVGRDWAIGRCHWQRGAPTVVPT